MEEGDMFSDESEENDHDVQIVESGSTDTLASTSQIGAEEEDSRESNQPPDVAIIEGSNTQPAAETSNGLQGVSTPQPSLNTSIDDFKSPKKYKAKAVQEKSDGQSDCHEDESECCPICFERWENSGRHRLASLRCGHLFGQSCIEKWLQGEGAKCPQCNAPANKKHIRLLYAKTLKMLDTSERDKALADLEQERKLRQKVEIETAQLRLNYQMALDECNRLREEVERQTSTLEVMRVQSTSSRTNVTSQSSLTPQKHNFVLDKTVKLSDQGNCRVMAYSPHSSVLCISQPSSSPLFPGFGIRKLCVADMRTSQYVAVHSKQIRDVNVRPTDDLVLTASLDKTVKLTSLVSNAVVQTYTLAAPAWSCAYSLHAPHVLYAGLLNGSVTVLDMRNTSSAVRSLDASGSRTPVVALQSVPTDIHSGMSRGGLLVGQLDKCTFYECNSDDYKLHMLPVDGSLSSVSVDTTSRHVLMTYRPTSRHPRLRHQLCALASRQVAGFDTCTLQPVHAWHGGSTQKLLSRNRLVPCPQGREGALLACAGDEATCSVHVWEATTGALRQKLSSTSPVMDICPIPLPDKYHLCSLTEKNLLVYTWR